MTGTAGTESHYTVIIIIRTALAFSSGNRTQIESIPSVIIGVIEKTVSQ